MSWRRRWDFDRAVLAALAHDGFRDQQPRAEEQGNDQQHDVHLCLRAAVVFGAVARLHKSMRPHYGRNHHQSGCDPPNQHAAAINEAEQGDGKRGNTTE